MKKITKAKTLTMKKTLSLLFLLFISAGIYSQGVITPLQYWQSISGSQNTIYKSKIVTDNSNNIYIAGATMNGSTSDILLVKYNSSGMQQWIAQYNGGGNGEDIATGLCLDTSGNVYMTGYETGTALNPTNVDLITIKYNSSGTQQWLTTYDGGFNAYDAGTDITVDNNGNVYVTGKSFNANANTDIVTIKYDPIGTQQWVTRYDHTTHLNDEGVKISVRNGAVVVSGIVQTTGTTYKYAVFTCEDVTGVQTASIINSTSYSGADQVNDMVQDSLGNIYIAGAIPVAWHGYDYSILKLNPTLNVVWQSTYNGSSNLDDIAKGIRVDALSNVFVTGYTTSTTGGKNFATIKYNSSGTQQWIQTYNDTLNADDESNALVLDNSANVYVTGYTTTALNHADYYTIKYNSSGVQQWTDETDGDAHLDDKATGIAIDNNGRIAVTGQSALTSTTYQYVTGKYIEKDVITPPDFNNESPASNFLFYKNSGQLINTSNQAIPDVKFYTNNISPQYYINNNSYSFVFAHVDTIASTQDTLHRIDLTFDGTSATGVTISKTYPLEEKKEYLNYFLSQCPNGITEVHGNQRLITPDLYQDIDLEFSSNQKGAKYYFVVKPGGDPTGIQLNYTGASSFNLDGNTNALTISSTIGSITYDRPTVYQLSATNTIIPITGWTADWQMNALTNKYKFNIGAYDHTKALIIEVDQGNGAPASPTAIENLNWSTYYGGSGNDYLDDSKTDASGNLYISGTSQAGLFPVTSGVYQNHNAGSTDAVALKFNALGQRIWATYIGGSGAEGSGGIAMDGSGNVYVVGFTVSGDFPVLPNGGAFYQSVIATNDGASDAFICKLDPTGTTAPWRTFYGGNKNDAFNAIKIDASGNIFIVGQTASSNFSIQASGGAYTQTCISGGLGNDEDGIILKFNSSGVRQWATCYGGTAPGEYIRDLDIDPSGNLFVTGLAATTGTGFPTLDLSGSSDYYNGTLSGYSDAFVAKFSNSGVRNWATLYGGSGSDYGTSVRTNSTGEIFVGGGTTSSNFPTQHSGAAYYQQFTGSGYDAFLLKFGSNLANTWATYYGGVGAEDIAGLTIDNNGVLYATGKTTSTNMPFPSVNPASTYTQAYTTGSNSYVIAFDNSLKNIWGTYIGGSKDDAGGTIVSDINSHLFVIGQTNSDTSSAVVFPLDNGAGVPFFQGIMGGGATWQTDGSITRFDVSSSVFVGVKEINNIERGLTVYPNPASNLLNVYFTNTSNSLVKFGIYNILGERIQSIDFGEQSGNVFHTIDISNLTKGIYFIQVQTDNKTINKKFIKQ